jgi:hypothetical protein
VQLVLEARRDAEVAAAAAQPPEQLAVLAVGGSNDAPVRGDELDRRQVVGGPAEPPCQVPESPAKRQARAAGRGHEPEHRRETVSLRFPVHVAEKTSWLGARDSPRRIDLNAPQRRHVEHQSTLADREARDVVPAALDRQRQAVRARRIDARDDVVDPGAPDDQRRAAIDYRVPHRTRLVVLGIAGLNQGPPNLALEITHHSLMTLDMLRISHDASPRLPPAPGTRLYRAFSRPSRGPAS